MSAAHSNERAEGSTMLAVLRGGRASSETAKTGAVLNISGVDHSARPHEMSGAPG